LLSYKIKRAHKINTGIILATTNHETYWQEFILPAILLCKPRSTGKSVNDLLKYIGIGTLLGG
jgi:formate-dependent nitrite reductase membrane component NrfD